MNYVYQLIMYSLFVLSIYPILGAINWVVGAFCYRFVFQHDIDEFERFTTDEQPFVTIMVPAHNEEVMIEDTLTYLLCELEYNNYEVLVLDDGSIDKTSLILTRMLKRYERLRVVHIEKNKGKADAFNIGLAFAKGEYILSNDADTVPEANCLH